MGPGAAHKARAILENSQYVASIELLVAAQGVDLRGGRGLGAGTRRVFQAIRRKVPSLSEDRSSHDDIEMIRSMVREGEIARIVTQVVGS
jgi:histidine ammonia-lyase